MSGTLGSAGGVAAPPLRGAKVDRGVSLPPDQSLVTKEEECCRYGSTCGIETGVDGRIDPALLISRGLQINNALLLFAPMQTPRPQRMCCAVVLGAYCRAKSPR